MFSKLRYWLLIATWLSLSWSYIPCRLRFYSIRLSNPRFERCHTANTPTRCRIKFPVLQDSISTRTDRGFNLQINQEHGIHSMDEKKGDLDPLPNKNNNNDMGYVIPLILAAAVAGLVFVGQSLDFGSLLSEAVSKVEELEPYGYLYFACVYIAAEILAIPVFPLTSSSGYLFGLLPGTLLVLTCATIAASISFYIGRTFLRAWAQDLIKDSQQWQAIDKAIGKQGFKVVLLLRLSPLLPFALSNYLYAVTSVDFLSFISATFLGFAPGSFGFVYFGSAGKDIFGDGGAPDAIPWYGYLAIGALILLGAQTVGKVATDAIKEMDIDSTADPDT